MPNWNYNCVTIYAPIEKVKEYFVKEEKHLYFNMHRLFPDTMPSSDPTGMETWDFDWAVENTGSKWFPDEISIHDDEQDKNKTYLSYDSAWTPNNLTLEQLHRKTGRMIINEYEEGGMSFEGTFECIDGNCEDYEREFQQSCEICEEKKPDDCYDEELEDFICKQCRSERDDGKRP